MRRSAAVAANRNDRLIQDKRHIRQIQQCIGDITRGEHVHAAQYNAPDKSAQLVANSPLRAKRVRRRRNERGHQDTFKGFLRSGNDYSPRGHQVAIDFE